MMAALLLALAAPASQYFGTGYESRHSDKLGCIETRSGGGAWETTCIGAKPDPLPDYHQHEHSYEWIVSPATEACYQIGRSPCLTLQQWRQQMLKLEEKARR